MKAPKATTSKDGGKRVAFETGEAFSQWMITEKLISTVPWDDAGPFLRFSATYEAADENAEDALYEQRRLDDGSDLHSSSSGG